MSVLISRVADHCFWFGRYLERAEATARTLRVTNNLSLGADATLQQLWLPVIIVAGEEARFGKVMGMDLAEEGERVQHYMTFHNENPSSIRGSVAALRENARAIRDQISTETWRAINELHLWLQEPIREERFPGEKFDFYTHVNRGMQQVHGLLSGTMLHDTPLQFIRLGGYLERASQTARILDVHHHTNKGAPASASINSAVWMSFLHALGAYETFMKRERGRIREPAVVRFLVLDRQFPRSIYYCINHSYDRLQSIVDEIPGDHNIGAASLRRLREFRDWIGDHNLESVLGAGVHEVLTQVVDEAHSVCHQIGCDFLGAA